MLTQVKHESYPECVSYGGLHHVDNAGGLHPLEHEDQGKETWIQQYAVTDGYAPEELSRRIGGLKPWLFWLILAIVSLIVIGASVGGAVGGTLAAKSSTALQSSSEQNSSIPSITSTPTTSIRSATSLSTSTSTSTPFITTDCPSSNGTSIKPNSPGGNAGKYTFTKHCGFDTNGTNLVSAFVPSFDTCIALCSNWNYQQTGGSKCNSVSFNVDGSEPGNCWAKTGTGLKSVDGQGAAILIEGG